MTESVQKLVAQAAVDAINVQTFSLTLEAKRHWRLFADRGAFDQPTVTAIPGQRQSQRITRGGDSQDSISLQVVVQMAFDPVSGETVPVDRCDPVADLAQEVEDYLRRNSLSISDNGTARLATPTGVSQSETVDDWLTDGVFAVSIAVDYTVTR